MQAAPGVPCGQGGGTVQNVQQVPDVRCQLDSGLPGQRLINKKKFHCRILWNFIFFRLAKIVCKKST
jgi:hypothetical protein